MSDTVVIGIDSNLIPSDKKNRLKYASKYYNGSFRNSSKKNKPEMCIRDSYYKVYKSENLKNTPTPGPSYNTGIIIEKGEPATLIPERKDPKKNTASLPIKIVGYKNGKPVMASYYCMKLNAGR